MKDTFSALILSQNVIGPSHWPAYGEQLRLIGALQYFTPAWHTGHVCYRLSWRLSRSQEIVQELQELSGDRGRPAAGCQSHWGHCQGSSGVGRHWRQRVSSDVITTWDSGRPRIMRTAETRPRLRQKKQNSIQKMRDLGNKKKWTALFMFSFWLVLCTK